MGRTFCVREREASGKDRTEEREPSRGRPDLPPAPGKKKGNKVHRWWKKKRMHQGGKERVDRRGGPLLWGEDLFQRGDDMIRLKKI